MRFKSIPSGITNIANPPAAFIWLPSAFWTTYVRSIDYHNRPKNKKSWPKPGSFYLLNDENLSAFAFDL
jgi:hypothetical protein